jgi:hypothetical protein
LFFFEIVEPYSLTAAHERTPCTIYCYPSRRNKAFIAYGCLILFFAVLLTLGRVNSSRMMNDFIIVNNSFIFFIERLMINKLNGELKKTNQRLDEIKIVSAENIEQKLTKQVRKKI